MARTKTQSQERRVFQLIATYVALAVLCFAAVGEFFWLECDGHDDCCEKESPWDCNCTSCTLVPMAVQIVAAQSAQSDNLPTAMIIRPMTAVESELVRAIDRPPRV